MSPIFLLVSDFHVKCGGLWSHPHRDFKITVGRWDKLTENFHVGSKFWVYCVFTQFTKIMEQNFKSRLIFPIYFEQKEKKSKRTISDNVWWFEIFRPDSLNPSRCSPPELSAQPYRQQHDLPPILDAKGTSLIFISALL